MLKTLESGFFFVGRFSQVAQWLAWRSLVAGPIPHARPTGRCGLMVCECDCQWVYVFINLYDALR